MLRDDKFGFRSGPPVATQAGWGNPQSRWGTPETGAPRGPIPPSDDPVSPWPPVGPTAEPTLRRGGVASATAVLLALICVTGVVGWNAVTPAIIENDVVVRDAEVPVWIFLAGIGAAILAVVTFFVPRIARITAPLYALGNGFFVGGISAMFEAAYDGIVLQAVGLTIGVFLAMLVLYATGRIRVTPRFRLMVFAATAGVCLIYLATFVLSLFGSNLPFIHDNGIIGIGFSLVVVGIAAMNLALDFDFVEQAEKAGAPRHMEWFAALGLTVTLVWLYLELLRLLAKLRSR